MPTGNLWLKIRIWTKVVVAALVGLYVLLFVIFNSGTQAEFWWWFGQAGRIQASILVLTFFAFLAGVVVTLLVRTIFRTLRQIRDSRERGRADRLEREIQEMKTKAATLRTRPNGASSEPPASPPAEDPTAPTDDEP